MDENEEELDYDTFVINVEEALNDAEVSQVLSKLKLTPQDVLEDVLNDLDNDETYIEPQQIEDEDGSIKTEKESDYAKRCIKTQVYKKIMEKYGRRLDRTDAIQGTVENQALNSRIQDMLQTGDVEEIQAVIEEGGVLPYKEADGKIVFIKLTDEQLQEFKKLYTRFEKPVMKALDDMELQDYKETQENELEEYEEEYEDEEFEEEYEEIDSQEEEKDVDETQRLDEESDEKSIDGLDEQDLEYDTETNLVEEIAQGRTPGKVRSDTTYIDKSTFKDSKQADRWSITPADTVNEVDSSVTTGTVNELTFNTDASIDDGLEDLTEFKEAGHEVKTEINGITVDTREADSPENVNTMYQEKVGVAKETAEEVRAKLGDAVFENLQTKSNIGKMEMAAVTIAQEREEELAKTTQKQQQQTRTGPEADELLEQINNGNAYEDR